MLDFEGVQGRDGRQRCQPGQEVSGGRAFYRGRHIGQADYPMLTNHVYSRVHWCTQVGAHVLANINKPCILYTVYSGVHFGVH